MPIDLLLKDAKDRVVLAVAVGAILIVFSAVAFAIYAPMADSLNAIASTFPTEILQIIGGIGPGGYVVSQLFNVLGPLALVAFAVTLGTSLLAGEEEDGTLGLLMAHPLSRTEVVAAKAVTLVAMVALATALFWLGVTVSASYQQVGLDQANIAGTCVHLFALSGAYGLIGLAAGAATGRPGTAGAWAGTITAVSYLSATMLPVAGLDQWSRLSPWHYYNASDPLTQGFDLGHVTWLAAVGAIAVAVAVISFARRDLRG
ncbi:MAG: ABC transporter permease subunit [Ornithinimicrobium sp.]